LHGGNVETKLYEALRDAVKEHFKDTGEKVWEIHVNWDSASKIQSVKLTASKSVYQKDD
jgi:cellobiose-specific phosphotransferase system component IIA